MRQRSTWQAYDDAARTGRYGSPADGGDEAAFFRAAVAGRRHILDVGCGPGGLLVALADCVKAVWGIDAAPSMLALARQTVTASGIANVYLARGLAEALPFADGVFDGFAISGTLESVADPAAVLAEVARVSTPGAVVASLEWDFESILASGAPRLQHHLRREPDGVALETTRYLTIPYRIRTERYLLDPDSDAVRRAVPDLGGLGDERVPIDLSPSQLPPSAIRDACYEEAAQFSPATLRHAFEAAGFETVEQRVALSFGVPHIFSVFGRPQS